MAGEYGSQTATIILHSGAYDRASFALALALGALAVGMEVEMLLTYDGLLRFTKGHLADMGEEPSEIVRTAFEKGLEQGVIQTLGNRICEAKELGMKLFACPASMAILGITEDDLVDEVDGMMGVVTFIAKAQTASINWYI